MLSLWLYCPEKSTDMPDGDDACWGCDYIAKQKKKTEDVDITYGETEKKKKTSLVTLCQNGFASSLRPICYSLFVAAFLLQPFCSCSHLCPMASGWTGIQGTTSQIHPMVGSHVLLLSPPPPQAAWHHCPQPSRSTACCVLPTPKLHTVQGYLGPGFNSISPQTSNSTHNSLPTIGARPPWPRLAVTNRWISLNMAVTAPTGDESDHRGTVHEVGPV